MSSSQELTQSELAVLESLQGATEAVSQRELARRSGLSVGLVNAVLKKLIHTGYVKTSRLNRRSLEYLLTPDGFAQTALRSYHYIIDTVRGYRDIQARLHTLVAKLRAEGRTEFYLHGEGELAELVSVFFEEDDLGRITRGMPSGDVLNCNKIAVFNVEPKPIRKKGILVIELLREFSGEAISEPARRTRTAANCVSDSKASVTAGLEGAARNFDRIEEFYGRSAKEDPD